VDLKGSTEPELALADVGLQDDGIHYRCRVRNAVGETVSKAAMLRVSRNQRPHARIESPSADFRYMAGTFLDYRGVGEDPEDGPLPPSAITWWVDLYHDDHAHPFQSAHSGTQSGTVYIPDWGETSDNVFYRINLKVTDNAGLSHITFVDVQPRKVTVTLTSTPPGLRILVDNQEVITPQALISVVGMKRNIRAISPQLLEGRWVDFKTWSDGGREIHTFITPPMESNLSTRFKAKPFYVRAFHLAGKCVGKLLVMMGRIPPSTQVTSN
jgi:hypothetical protein